MPAPFAVSCSSMQCRNSNLMLGNYTAQQSSAGCNVTSCSYGGFVNGTILTTYVLFLLAWFRAFRLCCRFIQTVFLMNLYLYFTGCLRIFSLDAQVTLILRKAYLLGCLVWRGFLCEILYRLERRTKHFL